METRAPFVVIGAFVLAAIVAVFGFVYWLNNTGGLGPRTSYHVQFEGSVPGLLVGAGVLFNGIRVGEVTDLALAPDNPRRVNAAELESRTAALAERFGLDAVGVEDALRQLMAEGRVLEGGFVPGGMHREWCDAEMLRLIRRKSLARLRREVERLLADPIQ